ncbi:CRISPR-associated helicase Cas3 [Lachnospiraceae bacterium TWA4]|nr:CRISPR-associated helicase Cas3 [Lachnospiraceae bacterium TWA4]
MDSADILKDSKKKVVGNVESYLQSKKKGQKFCSINNNRETIKKIVLSQINNLSIQKLKDCRLFTLTAPTGTGKTLTSIAAAMRLSERLKEVGIECTRIIEAVPFLNILEQTAKDFEGIFGVDEVTIHSSLVNPYRIKNKSEKFTSVQKRILQMNSWSSPVILTTFVQFFESIFTDQNQKLLKISRLVGAIVILDEIQSLELQRFPLYALAIDSIARYYGTRFILMTATQPKLFETRQLVQIKDPLKIYELLPNYKTYFESLNRTCLIPIMDQVNSLDTLIDFIIDVKDNANSILIVVNTIADSIELYNKLFKMDIKVVYLSTNITRIDRKIIIEKTKQLLKDNEYFIMVSTQTIEAGVDLDFDMAFRDLAPLSSIIQTAGRVNRSGNKGELLPVYIFDLGSSKKVYKFFEAYETKKLLNTEVNECQYQEFIENYYNVLLSEDKIDMSDSLEFINEGIKKLEYNKIKEYKMISEDERCSVIFLKDEYIINIVDELCKILISYDKSYETKAKIKSYFNEIEQYTVDIYPNKLKKNRPIEFSIYCKEICGKSIELNYFIVPFDDLERYYDENTGFIAEDEDIGAFLY